MLTKDGKYVPAFLIYHTMNQVGKANEGCKTVPVLKRSTEEPEAAAKIVTDGLGHHSTHLTLACSSHVFRHLPVETSQTLMEPSAEAEASSCPLGATEMLCTCAVETNQPLTAVPQSEREECFFDSDVIHNSQRCMAGQCHSSHLNIGLYGRSHDIYIER